MCYLLVVICVALSYLIVFLVCKRKFNKLFIGDIRIDNSTGDEPYLFLELNRELPYLYDKKYAIVKINRSNYISDDTEDKIAK